MEFQPKYSDTSINRKLSQSELHLVDDDGKCTLNSAKAESETKRSYQIKNNEIHAQISFMNTIKLKEHVKEQDYMNL